jgi:hypothetical protein
LTHSLALITPQRPFGVTRPPGSCSMPGLIGYQRGRITVLDRAGLEMRTCECYQVGECYQVVKTEYDRLLPYVVPSSPNHFPFAQ